MLEIDRTGFTVGQGQAWYVCRHLFDEQSKRVVDVPYEGPFKTEAEAHKRAVELALAEGKKKKEQPKVDARKCRKASVAQHRALQRSVFGATESES